MSELTQDQWERLFVRLECKIEDFLEEQRQALNLEKTERQTDDDALDSRVSALELTRKGQVAAKGLDHLDVDSLRNLFRELLTGDCDE